ncbi:hypothetical protein CCR95_19380 [Thiocystis minor]|uniref:restriction endonuclease subunit S n=1 Tax=Thiocystis minor TaxID=61597 RepID=UPI0019136FA3|nr:restriction endonuclease subunit S [Thiocystis minor]MBK5966184.1 hypothetical protein [Thiocystis minor]
MKLLYDNPLPPGWNEKPLTQAIQLRRGYTWTKENEIERPENGAVPVIRIPNVQDRLDLTDLLYLRDVSPEALEKAAVSKGWILFVGSNGSQDRIGDSVLLEKDQAMVFASFLMGMTSKDHNELLPEFLASWMRIHLVHEWFSKTSQQTTGLANYSWGAVKKLPLRFPSDINEQRRIAATLKLADDAIAKARAELEAARELKRSLTSELLHPPKAEHWQQTTFASLVSEKIRNGYSPTCPQDPTGAWVLSLDALNDDGFNPEGIKPAPIEDEGLLPFRLIADDILVSRSNTPELVGRSGRYAGRPDIAYYPDLMMRVRVDRALISPAFAEMLLQSTNARRWLKSRASGTSGSMVKIKRRDIMSLPILLPLPDQQNEIVGAVAAAKEAVTASEMRASALQQIKKSLLQNLLTGKIRLPPSPVS